MGSIDLRDYVCNCVWIGDDRIGAYVISKVVFKVEGLCMIKIFSILVTLIKNEPLVCIVDLVLELHYKVLEFCGHF
jgi:hypothetical protein